MLDKRAADLGSRQGELSEDITLVRERNRTSESQAQRSRQQAVEEVGGLNGRQPGAGRRHDAYERLAMEAAAAAAQASNTEAVLRPQLASVQEALRTLNGERLVAVRTHLTAMAGVSADMAQDPRHVPKLSGLFADATVFLSFYADPAQAMGLIVMTILGALCLASCELAPLLGARFRGDTPYDVDRLARSRADAARFVAEAEIDLARAYRESPLVTRPLAGAPTNRPQEHQP